MNINIKGSGIDLTPAIQDYAKKRVETLEKFISGIDGAHADIEVGKTTEHHKQGDVFRAEINLSAGQNAYRTVSEQSDLYAAIDDAKEQLERQMVAKKDRNSTLFRRGARSVKKMFKSISSRNPFTSKYEK